MNNSICHKEEEENSILIHPVTLTQHFNQFIILYSVTPKHSTVLLRRCHAAVNTERLKDLDVKSTSL